MPIFDRVVRTDDSPKLSIESDFQFLNRSSRPEMEAVRQFLDSLVSEHPDESELIARFRSGNNPQFRSAEYELLLFSALRRHGFELESHPTPPNGTSSRPDFLVTAPSGQCFYLEAVLASENSGDRTHHPLVATTLDVFSRNPHESFGLIVKTAGVPTTQPSRTKLLRETVRWLNSLNPDDVQATIDSSGRDSAPTMAWTHEQFSVFLTAVPLRKERRGKASQLLIAQFGQPGWIDSSDPIRSAIAFKGRKYGRLDAPLVVAVNVSNRHLDQSEEMEALFGDEQFTFSVSDPDAEPRITRASNGAWCDGSGPKLTRVSAAWIFNNLSVYSLTRAKGTLYLHPWAEHPISSDLLKFGHAVGVDGQMTWAEGLLLGDAFGLSPNWPE